MDLLFSSGSKDFEPSARPLSTLRRNDPPSFQKSNTMDTVRNTIKLFEFYRRQTFRTAFTSYIVYLPDSKYFDSHTCFSDVHVTVHCDKFLIIKPARCTNFSNLFLKWNSTCFGQFLCPSSGVFHCTHSNGICHTGLLTACDQDQDGTSWSCSQAVSKPVCHIPLLCVQWKTPDDGQTNCPQHVGFHFKNKFKKLAHLVGFIMRKPSLHHLQCVIMFP